MKINYLHLPEQPNSAIIKKICYQKQALQQLNIQTKVIIEDHAILYKNEKLCENYLFNITISIKNFLKKYNDFYHIMKYIIDTSTRNDILYIRYPPPTPHYLMALMRKRCCLIISEHQSIEKLEVGLNLNKNQGEFLIYLVFDKLFGKIIINNTDAIVGVTDEITQYQLSRAGDPKKPHITIGNGFDVASAPIRHPPPHIQTTLHLLCVANVSRWHGLDRLLRGLATHSGTPSVILHIAGDGAELPYLHQLTQELGISDQVIFHGFTTGKALDALFDECHIAVGSLGIHRIGLKEASILKAREYCARGIPFIYGILDPDFPPDFPYILQLPADESPIDIEQVIAFADKVLADPDHPQKMRLYAEEHLDWSVKMKKLKGFLEELVGEERPNP